jgi:hypothetical protein
MAVSIYARVTKGVRSPTILAHSSRTNICNGALYTTMSWTLKDAGAAWVSRALFDPVVVRSALTGVAFSKY